MPKALLLALGGPKSKPKGKGDDDAERTYAKEAYAALKDDDEDGFVEAFTSAVKACVKKAEAEEYDEED